ncbi:MAG: acyltransferase domain-containing protein, partial [Acidobacteria bacterium]|nr:acyltransferase domain-containing protein [Acidobacteriota bacterium]
DHIYAVIKGTAINNDGNRKVGYTAPSIEGQAEVVRTAMAMARIDAESIGYIETHGTGTPLGDQVEIEALKLAFSTNKKRFCGIGSVKTNIGHLDVAAGAAGFIKAVLALKHRVIPPSLHFETSNPAIDFENSPFYVVNRPTEWKGNGSQLRAGVSSFGIGGTNAHVILEEAPMLQANMQPASDSKYHLLPLSAKTPSALQRMSQNLVEYLRENPGINLADMAYTLQKGRQAFHYRRMAVCSNVNNAIEGFSAVESEKFHSVYVKEEAKSSIFMFSGLGSQYVNMGVDLYHNKSVFQNEMERCFAILKSIISYNLKDILYPPKEISISDTSSSIDVNNIEIAQLVVFLLEYALAKLIMNLGIKPRAMIGYSLGEYTAACLSGVFSLEDALKIIIKRGQLISKLPTGTMLSVPMQSQELIPLLGKEISLAIDNGFSCIVAGPDQHINAFQQKLKENRHLCMKLNNSHAVHSMMMEPILNEFAGYVRTITLNKPQIPYISNVTGQWITVQDAMDPGYWSRHLAQTVRFSEGIDLLRMEPNPIFIEIGPGRDLTTLLVRYKEKDQGLQAVNLIKMAQQDIPDNYYLLSKIGHLWLNGVHIDWNQLYTDEKRNRVPLPTYPFEKNRFWFEGNPFKLVEDMLSGQSLIPGKVNIQFINSQEEKTGASTQNKRLGLSTPYSPPSTEIEQILIDIWENYFGIKPVGIEDDFFELGGDSLKATIIVARIYKQLNIRMPISEIFNRSTIRRLSDYIKEAVQGIYISIDSVEKKEYYSFSSAQNRFYILYQMDRMGIEYNIPSCFVLDGEISKGRLEHTLKLLIGRHESLRTSFHMINGLLVQIIHPKVEFEIECFATG